MESHHSDVIMGVKSSQITGVSIVCSTYCPGAYQRKHQSSASLAFVRGIHRWPVDSPHKRPVTQIICPFDDAIMNLKMHSHVASGRAPLTCSGRWGVIMLLDRLRGLTYWGLKKMVSFCWQHFQTRFLERMWSYFVSNCVVAKRSFDNKLTLFQVIPCGRIGAKPHCWPGNWRKFATAGINKLIPRDRNGTVTANNIF